MYANYGIRPSRTRLVWLGRTAADVASFPEDAQDKLGTALRFAQEGRVHHAAKPMQGSLREVTEIAVRCEDGTYRLMYSVKIGEVIYVLHTFKKKATDGISTAKRYLALIEKRLKDAKEDA
jgi:phage-related protein